jgi:hypothetical protein
MTIPARREPRHCRSCGYAFIPDGPDSWYCSGICAGQAGMAEVIDALRRFAATAPGTPDNQRSRRQNG